MMLAVELNFRLKELGYYGVANYYHRILGNENEECSTFRHIENDSDMLKVYDYKPKNREVQIYYKCKLCH